MQKLERQYEEALRIKAPAKYWEALETKYSKSGVNWTWLAVLATVLTAACVAGVLYWPPFIFLNEHITAGGIKGALLLTFAVSLAAYVVHIFVRMATSAFHLSRDACERLQLSHVFLALTGGTAMKDDDRKIILTALYSRADTGLLRGDGAPAFPGTIGAVTEIFKSK